ncbi:hypothetical protein [Tsukamurella tyrosinosolvens]|uniref:hypothetical protein n=1 Tax=Tsukamurella tyrosinosolvens TaxID=57704 RepID=UPI000C7F339C|nr:hypothetical protein [Tsukamurella tyrosinosolvens]AUN41685.1 hypothetical protein ASU32_18100 [Tsukamurella tyrosinosolvens]
MTNDNGTAPAPATKSTKLALLSDIRTVIAALLGIYGVLLLIAGLVPSFAELGARDFEHTPDRVDMAAGSAGNLWVGGALVVVAIAFETWAVMGVKRAGGR